MLCIGRCQTLDDLRKETHLSERQIEATVAFLVNYGFVETDKESGLKITETAKKLFTPTL
jgi:hypothetical protein